MRDVVRPERQHQQCGEGFHQRHHKGGGGTEAGASRRIDIRREAERHHAAVGELASDPACHPGMQLQPRRRERVEIGREILRDAQIGGDEMHPSVIRRLDEGVGITVDRRIEHGTAVLVAVWAEVGASAGEAEP